MPEHDIPDPSNIVSGSRLRCPKRPFGDDDENHTSTSGNHTTTEIKPSSENTLRHPEKRTKPTDLSEDINANESDEVQWIENPKAPSQPGVYLHSMST